MNAITLIQHKSEARVDSRLLANQLGNKHKSTIELIDRYADKFKRFGLLPFQTESVKEAGARGTKHYRYVLLNEDQAYFLLSLSRNTEQVVDLKASLVMAFREARYGYANQTLEDRKQEASRCGRQLAHWRYDKPSLHQHVAHLREQLKLPIDLEGGHP
ncbi:MAG: Rha family transcriptional regulator [Gammaproteobacteria bacterium]